MRTLFPVIKDDPIRIREEKSRLRYYII